MAHTFNKINQNSITLKKKGGIKLTKIQTNIGDLKKHLEDLQSITNANISRLQNHLQFTSSANFKDLSYIDQRNHLDALSNNGSYLKDYIRESISKIDKIAFDIFLSTRFSCGDRSKLSMLIDIERARVNKTPAKDIPYNIFKAMIDDEGIPVDERNKLIKDRGDKRFKELL